MEEKDVHVAVLKEVRSAIAALDAESRIAIEHRARAIRLLTEDEAGSYALALVGAERAI